MTLGEEYPCPYCKSEKLNFRTRTFIEGEWGFGYTKTQWYCTKCQTTGPLLRYNASEGWKKITNKKPEQIDLFKAAPVEEKQIQQTTAGNSDE